MFIKIKKDKPHGYSVKMDSKEISGYITDMDINIKQDKTVLQLKIPVQIAENNGDGILLELLSDV